MSAVTFRLPGAKRAPATTPADPAAALVPFALARGGAVVALAVFGSLHWMQMLEPSAPFRAWEAVGAAVLMLVALWQAATVKRAWLRWLAVSAVAVSGFALAVLAAGVGDEYLRPDRWGALASGIGRGIEALPGVRVPYRGIDEWTRHVLAAGGTVLVVLAAGLAFWPRSGGRTGFRWAALLVLVVLYVVPTVALVIDGEFARGALLVLLVIAFLRLERLRRRDVGPAGLIAGGAVVLALVVGPVLDRSTPWWDYETWALSAASAKTTSFSWDHDYGPLNWPRDGRELLRVKARTSAYWKAENLDYFDGSTWRSLPYGGIRASVTQVPDPIADVRGAQKWNQRIRVSVRNLVSLQLITAGATRSVDYSRATNLTGSGVLVAAGGRPLRRGDTYSAQVYTPDPTPGQLRVSGVAYDQWLEPYRMVGLPAASGDYPQRVSFPAWGVTGGPVEISQRFPGGAEPAGDAVAVSSLGRVSDLVQRLRAGSASPYDYVRRVEQYLGQDEFTYTESPPPEAATLDGFLFDARQGYCQQYSGAMALLLRMGGIPARVAAGFTSGSFDKEEREYVVRDFDAHSWVEAWFPGYGWVTFDPTPSSAPPRSQASGVVAGSGGIPGAAAAPGPSDRASDPSSPTVAGESGTPWAIIAGVAGAIALIASAFAVGRRRRRRRRRRLLASQHPAFTPLLAELERALRRSGRGPRPGMTLQALETALAASPKAASYVRALREQRYRDTARGPTRAERRALRAELARGSGPSGRVRAWWALPPRI